jgi:hypothetical protein
MIIILLLNEIYYKDDKNIIYDILEKESVNYNKFKFINIIKTLDINYNYYNIDKFLNNIDNIILSDKIEFFNLLNEQNENLSIDKIINKLFINKILKPISDEFLLINNNTLFFINKKGGSIKK